MKKVLIVLGLAMAAFSFQASAATLTWGKITGTGVAAGVTDAGQVTKQDLYGSVIKIGNNFSVNDTWSFNLSASQGVEINISSLKVIPTWLTKVSLDGTALTQLGGSTIGSWLFNGVLAAGDHYIELVGTTNGGNSGYQLNAQTPIPAAIWLFGSALMGLTGVSRRKAAKA